MSDVLSEHDLSLAQRAQNVILLVSLCSRFAGFASCSAFYKRTCQTSCLSTTCRSLNGRKMSFCLFHFARATRASHPAQHHQCCFKWHLLSLVTSASRSRPTGQILLWVTLRSNRHGLSFNTPKIFLTHSYQKHQNQLHLKGEIRSFVQEIVAF